MFPFFIYLLLSIKDKKMKKLLLSLSVISVFASGMKAQTNFGLNSWAQIYPPFVTAEDPTGWASFNVLTSSLTGSMAQTVFKETTAPYEGSAAAKIVTDVIPASVTIPNPFVPGQNLDTVGMLAIGMVQPTAPYVFYGAPYAARPATLTFASMYTPQPGDSAFVLVYLTRWNGASIDTVAKGKYQTGATTASYALNTINLIYNPAFNAVWSDTARVFASSSIYNHNGAKKGSIFYVDAFSFNGWVSTNDIDGVKNSVTTFPNPATNNVSIKCSVTAKIVEVMDITGRKVGTYLMNDNAVTIETLGFVPGLYIYNVIDEKNKVLNRGKFEVTK